MDNEPAANPDVATFDPQGMSLEQAAAVATLKVVAAKVLDPATQQGVILVMTRAAAGASILTDISTVPNRTGQLRRMLDLQDLLRQVLARVETTITVLQAASGQAQPADQYNRMHLWVNARGDVYVAATMASAKRFIESFLPDMSEEHLRGLTQLHDATPIETPQGTAVAWEWAERAFLQATGDGGRRDDFGYYLGTDGNQGMRILQTQDAVLAAGRLEFHGPPAGRGEYRRP